MDPAVALGECTCTPCATNRLLKIRKLSYTTRIEYGNNTELKTRGITVTTAHEPHKNHDIEYGDDEQPTSAHRGLFAVFAMPDDRRLELHIPEALGILRGGYSYATAPSFLIKNPDGSIEHSGDLVME